MVGINMIRGGTFKEINFNEIYEECPDNRVIQYIGIYLSDKFI